MHPMSRGHKNTQRGLHSPLSDQTELDKITDHHKLQVKSSQESLPDGGIASAYEEKCSRASQKSRISGVLQPTILVPKPKKKQWRLILDLRNLNKFLKAEKFKIDTLETISTSLQTGAWVTSIDLKGCLLPHIHLKSIQTIPKVSHPGSKKGGVLT